MRKFTLSMLLLAAVTAIAADGRAQCCSAACTNGFISIFDGKTFNGWTKRGGPAQYTIEDGVITGAPKLGEGNTFLCTDKHYGDFILELDFFQHKINSGVQIRSHENDDFKKNRVHGYQVEMDPGSRAWSGGIYDEARRAWINNLLGNDAARHAYKSEAWNHYRIEAIGDHIRTWVNGVPAADLVDAMTLEGFIGLQIHATKHPDDDYVKWKNIRIKDLGQHGWKTLWDLESLDQCTTIGPAKWNLENQVLSIATDGSDEGLLISNEPMQNFTISLMFKVDQGQAQVIFRTYQDLEDNNFYGYHVVLDDQKDGMTGGLIEDGVRSLITKPYKGLIKDWNNREWMEYKPGQWNKLTVSCHEHRIAVFINDRKTAELKLDPGLLRYQPKEKILDRIGFQTVAGQPAKVMIKDIKQLVKTN